MPRDFERMQQRRGTAAEWLAAGVPDLLAGEIGIETDTGYIKVGPGAWVDLPYSNQVGTVVGDASQLTGVAPLSVIPVLSNAKLPVVDAAHLTTDVQTTNGERPVGKGETVTLASDHCTEDGVSDETANLTAAIAAAAASQSKVLRLTPGVTYRTSAGLNTAGVTVEAYAATVKPLDGAAAFSVLNFGAGRVVWRGGTVDGNKANLTGTPVAAVYANGAFTSIDLTDLTVTNSADRGIQLLGPAGVTDPALVDSGPVTLTRCTVTAANVYGIMVSRCVGVTVTDCEASDNGNAGMFLSLCRSMRVSGCTTSGNGTHGICPIYCTQVRVTDNECDGNTQSGIAFGGGSAANTPSTFGAVVGNNCSGNGFHGIQLDTTVTAGVTVPWHGTVTGNTCDRNTNHGIYVNNSSDAAITGNTCRQNSLSGIVVNADDVALSGNSCTGNSAYGIGFFDHGAGVTVGANTVRSNTSGQYQVSGTTTAPQFASLSTTPPA